MGAALAAALVAAVSASAAGPADEADQQRAVLEDLQAGEEQALVDLFAADSALGRAEARAQQLEERLQGVRDRVGETQRSLKISQSNLLVARKLLSERIEQWYRMDEIDAIEIILGSDSLSDVIDQFNAIERMSSRDAEVIRGTRDFAAETKERQRSLRDQERQVEQLVVAARTEADRLAAARAAKEALVSDLRRQATLTVTRIDRLDRAAQEAAARAAAIQAEAAASGGGSPTADPARSGGGDGGDGGDVAAPPPPDETPTPDASGGRQLTVEATAYSIHGTTASGLPTAYGVCATDPSVIPMGTSFSVPGYGTCVAGDTGSAIIGNIIDVWFPELAQAQAWGRKTLTITILG